MVDVYAKCRSIVNIPYMDSMGVIEVRLFLSKGSAILAAKIGVLLFVGKGRHLLF